MLDNTLEVNSFDNRYAGDAKLYVVFTMHAVKNGGRTEQEGRPIFDDVPHVRIHVPGDKTSVVERPATDEDKQRFAAQWQKFEKNMAQSPEGTPLEQWPLMSVGQVQEFKAMNVFTVEQLAGMSDANAQRFLGGHEIRRKADAFLKVSKDTAEAQRLATANAELQEQLDEAHRQLRMVIERVDMLEAMEERAANKGKSAANKGKMSEAA